MRHSRTAALLLLGVIWVAPFLYMVSVSLMGETELLRWPPPLLPHAPQWSNYAAAIAALPLGRTLVNTTVVAGCVMVGQVITSAAAGYALARLRFPGRRGVVAVLLLLLMVPAITLVIPRALVTQALGWNDTFAALITTELVSVWGILLMRQFFFVQPRDVEDAARLDGADEWTLFWRVMLPLARPAVLAIAAIAFLEQWRNFLWPLLVTRRDELQVAELALARVHADYGANWPYQMAAAVLVTVPLLVVSLFALRYLTRAYRTIGPRSAV